MLLFLIILILQSLENLLSSIQTAVQSSTNPLEHEIRVYLAEPLLPQDFSPDTWWGSNLSRFPHLARFARQYLLHQQLLSPLKQHSVLPEISSPIGGHDYLQKMPKC